MNQQAQATVQSTDTLTYTPPPGMTATEFRAMGTTISLTLPLAQSSEGTQAIQALFAEWEATLSRFRPESELSWLNAHTGAPAPVSPLLLNVTQHALAAAAATQGRYDPTLLYALLRVGYDRSFESLAHDGAAQEPATTLTPAYDLLNVRGAYGNWRRIVVDSQSATITLPRGVGLDFGGIAKGMAVDAALERLRALGVPSAIVNAGGDLAVLGLAPSEEDWLVAVPGRTQGWVVPLHSGAMATSGIARRQWLRGGKPQHHLLDPQTGEPVANELWSVTVVAGRCELAEVAAKAAFVAGEREGAALMERIGLAGLLVRRDGHWRAAGAWHEAAVRPLAQE